MGAPAIPPSTPQTRGISSATLAPKSYLGNVVTRCGMPNYFDNTKKSIQCRSVHYARDALSVIQVAYPNFFGLAKTGEVPTGADATITLYVEYPAGTLTKATFGGAAQGTIPNGSFLFSDKCALAVPIPRNAMFWLWPNITNPAGVVSNIFSANPATSTFSFDRSSISAAAQADLAPSGFASLNPAGQVLLPFAVIGSTTRPSPMLIGDSIDQGLQELLNDPTGDLGIIARSVGPYYAYANYGLSGDTIAAMLTGSANRLAVAKYFTHALSDYGGPNDSARAASAVVTDMIALGALLRAANPNLKLGQTTRMPLSTDTSSAPWTTFANQVSTAASYLLVINQAIRAGMQNWDFFWDTGGVVEAVPDSSCWATGPNGAALTPDGVHPNTLASQIIARSGACRIEDLLDPLVISALLGGTTSALGSSTTTSITSSQITDATTIGDELLTAATIGTAQTLLGLPSLIGDMPGQNALINARFSVNQRGYGGGTAAAGAYTFDRWKAGPSGANLSFDQAVPDCTVTIGAGTLIQAVDVENICSSTFWLTWVGSATARVWQGSYPTSAALPFSAGVSMVVAGVTVKALEITGLALGTITNVEFNAGGTVRIPQFEAALPNAGPTRFQRRHGETALCLRYFYAYQVSATTEFFARLGTNNPNAFITKSFSAPMRAAPTITATAGSGGTLNGNPSANFVNSEQVCLSAGTQQPTDYIYLLTFTADAELH